MNSTSMTLKATLITVALALANSAWAADAKSSRQKTREKVGHAMKAATEDLNEAILSTKIRMHLLKSLAGADATRVGVSVRGTEVTLTGQAEDRATLLVAAEAARSVGGVTKVESTITHNPRAPHQENFETAVKDGMLTADVRLRLLIEVGPPAVSIHVTATDGTVSLRGEVPNETIRSLAMEKVTGMTNVKRVEDLMTTTP